MADRQIRLYYKNVLADVIGTEHGITKEQLDGLSKQITPIIPKIKDEITGGSTSLTTSGATRYGLLPADKQIPRLVKRMVRKLKPKCENLVVLGIGGSALGNIALQTALNPYTWNLDYNARRGPRLFIFDNVDPAQFGSFLDYISTRLGRTIFNVISKSGQTAETAAQLMIIQKLLMAKFGAKRLREQVVATTDSK